MPSVTVEKLQTYYVHRRPVPQRHPPVVFVHGVGGTHQHWLYQVRDLPSSSSYAPDLPGHGRSEGSGREDISAYGDWLVAFLDAAGLERAVLVGHSMGGAIALDVAFRYPDRVAGLGLVATGGRLRVAPAILEAIQQDPKAAQQLIVECTYGPEAPPEMVRLGQRQMSEVPAEVLYGDFLACDRFNILDRLPEIRARTLILCGTQDRMTPSKYAFYLRDHIAGAKVELIEGAGHMVMVERPEAVARFLVACLDNL